MVGYEAKYSFKQELVDGEMVLEDLSYNYDGYYTSSRSLGFTGRGTGRPAYAEDKHYVSDLVLKFPGYAGKAVLAYSLSEDGEVIPKVYVDMTPLCDKFQEGIFGYKCSGYDEENYFTAYKAGYVNKLIQGIGAEIDWQESLEIKKIEAPDDIVAKVFKEAMLSKGMKIIQPEELSKLEEEAKKPYITKEGIEIFAKYVGGISKTGKSIMEMFFQLSS